MPSPFPGMNPYLERRSIWHDFHERCVPAIADALAAQAAPQFVVRIDEHVYIHELEEERLFLGRADVGVSSTEPITTDAPVAILQAPAQVRLPQVDSERLSFVEIRDRDSWQVITILELLSPANKYAGPDREQYLGKRGQIIASPTHLVEIDLLRGGPRMPMQLLGPCDYCVMVSRWQDRPRADVWPIALKQRLPVVPVPLAEGHASLELDLQALLDRVYDAARYVNYIYRGEPEPRLSDADQSWSRSLIPTA